MTLYTSIYKHKPIYTYTYQYFDTAQDRGHNPDPTRDSQRDSDRHGDSDRMSIGASEACQWEMEDSGSGSDRLGRRDGRGCTGEPIPQYTLAITQKLLLPARSSGDFSALDPVGLQPRVGGVPLKPR